MHQTGFTLIQGLLNKTGVEQVQVTVTVDGTTGDYPKIKMKNKLVILEYRQAKAVRGGKKPTWGFCFKTTDGQTLLESGTGFTSLAEAEQGFVSLVKSIATNEYQVAYPVKARALANN